MWRKRPGGAVVAAKDGQKKTGNPSYVVPPGGVFAVFLKLVMAWMAYIRAGRELRSPCPSSARDARGQSELVTTGCQAPGELLGRDPEGGQESPRAPEE